MFNRQIAKDYLRSPRLGAVRHDFLRSRPLTFTQEDRTQLDWPVPWLVRILGDVGESLVETLQVGELRYYAGRHRTRLTELHLEPCLVRLLPDELPDPSLATDLYLLTVGAVACRALALIDGIAAGGVTILADVREHQIWGG